jgi:hypothetical protein
MFQVVMLQVAMLQVAMLQVCVLRVFQVLQLVPLPFDAVSPLQRQRVMTDLDEALRPELESALATQVSTAARVVRQLELAESLFVESLFVARTVRQVSSVGR